jgi:anti-sigma factor (TIGR02949 family)
MVRLEHVIPISCREVYQQVSNYIDNEIDGELRARLEAHLQECTHCAAIVDGTKNIVKLVASGNIFELPPGFGARLYTRLAGHINQGGM